MSLQVDAPQFWTDPARPHLGGYIIGGDRATHFPELYEWLVQKHGVTSVLDVGCGEGWAMRYFGRLGCMVAGVDGVEQEHEFIIEHDYTTGPLELVAQFDLVWSCEFVEHVEERYIPNFMATFRAGRLVLMTHAGEGQQGYHHVNCRSADYWIEKMSAGGFSFDANLTEITRELAAGNVDPYNHYRERGLAFVRA